MGDRVRGGGDIESGRGLDEGRAVGGLGKMLP